MKAAICAAIMPMVLGPCTSTPLCQSIVMWHTMASRKPARPKLSHLRQQQKPAHQQLVSQRIEQHLLHLGNHMLLCCVGITAARYVLE